MRTYPSLIDVMAATDEHYRSSTQAGIGNDNNSSISYAHVSIEKLNPGVVSMAYLV